MDITTLQVVEGRAAKGEGVEPDDEEFEVAAGITDEAEEPEAPELSIAELEEIFSELN